MMAQKPRRGQGVALPSLTLGLFLAGLLFGYYRGARLPDLEARAIDTGLYLLPLPVALLACLLIGTAVALWAVVLWKHRHHLRRLYAPRTGTIIATVGLWLCLSLPVVGWVPVANAIALLWLFVASAPVSAMVVFVVFEISLLLLTYVFAAPLVAGLKGQRARAVALALVWWAVYLGGALFSGIAPSVL